MKAFVVHLAIALVGLSAALTAVAKPAYETEEWKRTRELTWARPGSNGGIGDARNWLEDGKPARKGPDRDTDIILPKASKRYRVSGSSRDQVRHVTIEANAELKGRHRNEIEIWGNCHVKDGGWIQYVSIRGGKHTFFRIDGAEFPNRKNNEGYRHPAGRHPKGKQESRSQISHKFQICKFGTASVEFIGNIGVSDEVMLQHGKMIVSGDFRWSGVTGKGAFEIYDGGILEIQSGGRAGSFAETNRKSVFNIDVYRNGVIQAGSPERPLTEDAFLLLGFGNNSKVGRTGLYAALGSMIRVYTTDPRRARLVIASTSSVPDFHSGTGKPLGNPDRKAAGKNGIAMQLAGDVDFNAVTMDYVCEGGIGVADHLDPKEWKDLKFGPHCAASNGKLFSKMKRDPNAYYHNRGSDQHTEYALTRRAVQSMQGYLKSNDKFQLSTTPANTKMKRIGGGKKSFDTPIAVVFDKPIEVAVKCQVDDAKIKYTTDGTEPGRSSKSYTGPIKIDKTTKLMIKAYKSGIGFSPTYSTVYVFK